MNWRSRLLACGAALVAGWAGAQTLPLPPRPADAPSGSALTARLSGLSLAEREKEIAAQVLAGNVPDFLRRFQPVTSILVTDGTTNTVVFYAAPDYLSLGSDADYFLMPISPATAQRLADRLDCVLPTPRMVDLIYAAATVKLAPGPIPPSPAMTTVAVFSNHNAIVRAQRLSVGAEHPLGELVAGHKKDVVVTARLAAAPGKVAIYGWHQTNGIAIQPLYLGHTNTWVDYSQCIRLVQRRVQLNGEAVPIEHILTNAALAPLLSGEGVVASARYPSAAATTAPASPQWPAFSGFTENPAGEERFADFSIAPGVLVHLSLPPEKEMAGKPVELVFYGLPNGNTIEQTLGRKLQPGDDWHFDIQHIAAQTRFLRREVTDRSIAVACLQAGQKSWPAWRRQNGDQRIPGILESIAALVPGNVTTWTLSGHSGGGSLIFGYLNAVTNVSDRVRRIAFLDSNYAYDKSLHLEKLTRWLSAADPHFLCVLAYNDAVALLDGKPFVSAAGGTWGKSHEMQRDLAAEFQFATPAKAGFERYVALDGRLQFVLKENPERKIFHTVQVERNGFIHALVSGTPLESRGYEYFGERAYTEFIPGK